LNEKIVCDRLFFMPTGSNLGLICFLAFAVIAPCPALGGQPEKTTYYVQLIRGNDEGQPPDSGAKAIGPKLSKSLHAAFRWKNYWEINRQKVEVAAGTKTRITLSKERAVEIDLSQPEKRKVMAFSYDKPICVSTQPISKSMTIIGADRGAKSSWFAVVRRDKPSIE
jgi:hypothetical protein